MLTNISFEKVGARSRGDGDVPCCSSNDLLNYHIIIIHMVQILDIWQTQYLLVIAQWHIAGEKHCHPSLVLILNGHNTLNYMNGIEMSQYISMHGQRSLECDLQRKINVESHRCATMIWPQHNNPVPGCNNTFSPIPMAHYAETMLNSSDQVESDNRISKALLSQKEELSLPQCDFSHI